MQEQKQVFEPEKDPLFGNVYEEKIIVAIIAIDLLLLPIGVPVAVRQKTTFRTGCVVSAPTVAYR
jgi:hypothetical protein